MDITRQQAQKEQTRGKIMAAAFTVYTEQGFSAPTSAIAKLAGVAHGTLFLHFPTQSDLLVALLEEFGNTTGKKLHVLAETCGSIEELLAVHVDALAENEQFYTRIISETTLLPPSSKTVFEALENDVQFHFKRLIDRGIEEKDVRRLPAHLLFHMWIGVVHYYLQNKENFSPDSPVLKKYKKQLIFTFCELIRR